MGGRPPADYRVDRPEVEAPQGAREPTGTNGPTLTTIINHKRIHRMVDRHDKVLVATMRITTNTTPKTTTGDLSEYWLNHLVVVIAAGKRPASIPNLEAKPASADGTAPGRVWESRTPPQHSSRGGFGTLFQTPLFFTYTHPHNTHKQPTPLSRNEPGRHRLNLLAFVSAFCCIRMKF